MDRRLKVAEFAALLGIVPKTVYKMIERNEIVTVTEKVNNRQTTIVVTNDEQIEEFKKSYSKNQVNNGNYYENVTENEYSENYIERNEQVKNHNGAEFANEVIDKIITLNNEYNEQINEYNNRLERVNEELITAKSKMLLLEDKAGREGTYINEINELRTGNNKLKKVVYSLVSVIVVLLLILTCYTTYNIVISRPRNSQTLTTEQISVVNPKKNEVKLIAQPRDKRIKK